MDINALIQNISARKTKLYQRDFLLTWEKTDDELHTILDIARVLMLMREKNISPKIFDSGLAVSLFRDNSTRTRFSYSSACNLLGLTVQDLDEGKSQISHGETVRETANMISFLTDAIGIRDDMYLGRGNHYMREVGLALDDGYQSKVLPQRPTIVNLQCDMDHPTQSMADLMHLQQEFGSLENLKGKKIAMTWAYSPSYGKPLSVPQGIIALMSRFGMDVHLAYPEGYDLIGDITDIARINSEETGGSFTMGHSMEDAFKDADIIYPKSWAPYQVMEKRTELLRNNDSKGLEKLEKSCLAQNANYKNWECNEEKMKLTKNGEGLYMHCLPADISGMSCIEGEVESSVFEKYRIKTYNEAGYKPYIIAAMIMAGRFENPGEMLKNIFSNNMSRINF